MTDRPGLDAVADALAVLDQARTYGYSLGAAYEASLARLADLDTEQVQAAAAALAALVVFRARHRGDGPGLAWWLDRVRSELPARESL